MLRKILAFFSLVLFFATTASALTIQDYNTQNPTGSIFGHNHNYSVVFRGNGEAVINLRVLFTNNSENAVNEYELRLPEGVSLNNVQAFQVIKEPRCTRYAYQETETTQTLSSAIQKSGTCVNSTSFSSCPLAKAEDGEKCSWYTCQGAGYCLKESLKTQVKCAGQVNRTQVCAEYAQDSDVSSYYGQNSYQKLDYTQEGDTLKVKLNQPVEKEKSGGFFVYARAAGYATRDVFGAYEFKFATFKVNSEIQKVGVGISSDTDYRMKGVTSEVDYRFDTVAESSLPNLSMAGAPAKSQAIDSYFQRIGTGSISKSATNLAPLESFEVTGAFAKTFPMLYAKEVIVGLFVLALVVLGVFFVARRIIRKLRSGTPKDKEADTGQSKGHGPSSLFLAITVSFGSVVLILLMTGVIYLLTSVIGFSGFYSSYGSIPVLSTMLWVVILIVIFSIYGFLLIGPAVLVGSRRGPGWGLATFVMTIVWFIIIIVVIGLILLLSGSGRNKYPTPIY